METKRFFQFEIIINVPVSFEFLCYGSPAIINIFTLTVWGSNLTKVDPHAVRVNLLSYFIEIFNHLKICLADAMHNFKGVKIIQILAD